MEMEESMSNNAPAAYATKRWNPTTGCSPISAGCLHCWARLFAWRHAGRFGYHKSDPFRPTHHPARLSEPLRWRTPQVVAVGFMGDLFHPDLFTQVIAAAFGVMAATPQHTYLLLTKRPVQAKRFFEELAEVARNTGRAIDTQLQVSAEVFVDLPKHAVKGSYLSFPWPLPNVWLGVSAEDQATADERLRVLRRLPAAHRWLSLEPQLGAVDLSYHLNLHSGTVPSESCRSLDWVVQGCESGALRRPFGLAWARKTRDQCRAVGVPYYLKQRSEIQCLIQDERIPACPIDPCIGDGTVDQPTCANTRVWKAPQLDGVPQLALPWR